MTPKRLDKMRIAPHHVFEKLDRVYDRGEGHIAGRGDSDVPPHGLSWDYGPLADAAPERLAPQYWQVGQTIEMPARVLRRISITIEPGLFGTGP
jgi:hypothetical protein